MINAPILSRLEIECEAALAVQVAAVRAGKLQDGDGWVRRIGAPKPRRPLVSLPLPGHAERQDFGRVDYYWRTERGFQ